MAVVSHPLIQALIHSQKSQYPEDGCHRPSQRELPTDPAHTRCPTYDLTLTGYRVDRFQQVLLRESLL